MFMILHLTSMGSMVVLKTKKLNEQSNFHDCVANKNNNAMWSLWVVPILFRLSDHTKAKLFWRRRRPFWTFIFLIVTKSWKTPSEC